jgi:hypothetical protein
MTGWVIATEYSAKFLGGGHAQFDVAQPLVEQRLLVCVEPTRSRPFTIRTNLVHVRSDTACLIEISLPQASADLPAGGQEFFAVLPGSVLTVAADALAPKSTAA